MNNVLPGAVRFTADHLEGPWDIIALYPECSGLGRQPSIPRGQRTPGVTVEYPAYVILAAKRRP